VRIGNVGYVPVRRSTPALQGRGAQLDVLRDAMARAAARHLTVVIVEGEAGIGKSRLLDEFQAWTEDHPETVYLFRGRASPQTKNQPFGLLRDIIGWRLQLADDDTLDEAKVKFEQGLIPLFADEPEFAEGQAHLLGHLIGLDWKESPHVRAILDDPSRSATARSTLQHRCSAG